MAELDDGEHLILQPRSPDAFLGHRVRRTDTGWRLERELLPGCDPKPKKERNGVRQQYAQNLEHAFGFDLGNPGWAALRAEYKNHARARFDVTTVEIQEIDPQGCGEPGDIVIHQVRVGPGTRSIDVARRAEIGVDTMKWVPLKAAGRSFKDLKVDVAWPDELAWSYAAAPIAGAGIGLKATVATGTVQDQEVYQLEVFAAQRALLVVTLREADGTINVLYPHPRRPSEVPAGETVRLPVRAVLRDPAQGTSDVLYVYAFADARTYEFMRPPSGPLDSTAAAKYVDELKAKLRTIPQWRRDEDEVHIEILPRK